MATAISSSSLSRMLLHVVRRRSSDLHRFPHSLHFSTRSYSSSAFHSPSAQAFVYDSHGAPDRVLKSMEIPGRKLQDGEVCVKMLAAPINPSDINKIEGVYPVKPSDFPAIGGNEGVASVIAVAPDVRSVAVNDWVVPAHSTVGTWSTYVIGKEAVWYKVPKDVPVEYSATISINPTTAFRMLKDFVTLEAGDVVVQNGATSLVGQCVIQLAHKWGLQTVNLIRDRANVEDVKNQLKLLGATHVFTDVEWESIDRKELFAGKSGPRLGLNCVGGSAASAVLKLLGEGGTMVTYGGMAKKPITVSTSALIFKDVQLNGFWLHKWLTKHTQAEYLSMTNYLLELARDGHLKYSMEKVPFSAFDLALQKSLGMHGSAPKQLLIFDA